MRPLRPDQTSILSQPENDRDGKRLDELRRTIARLQTPAVGLEAPGETPLGLPEVDRTLGGGLTRGALHEIAACGEAHIAAATGFALGVAALPSPRLWGEGAERRSREAGEGDSPRVRMLGESPSPGSFRFAQRSDPRSSRGQALSPQAGRGEGKSIVWVAEDMTLIESGAPYGPGLDVFGLAPERLLTVAAAKPGDVLWTMEEALQCRAVSIVIGEIRSSREIDLVATRRLSLAAAVHGGTALLLRTAPGTEASAALTRWTAQAVSSPHGIGPPRFDLTLTRNRRGPLGSWMLEWSVIDASFILAAHSQPLARPPLDRPYRARAA